MVQTINSPSSDGYDPLVQAMKRFSERATRAERQRVKSPEIAWPVRKAEPKPEATPIIPRFYAEPLAPLRDRDEIALHDIFHMDHLEDAVADIQNRLNHLYPEPCWEDDPYDFLHNYL